MGISSARKRVHAAGFAYVRTVMLAISGPSSAHARSRVAAVQRQSFSTALYQSSQFEAPRVSLRNNNSHVEQRHGGRRDAVTVSRRVTCSDRAHETAWLGVGDLSPGGGVVRCVPTEVHQGVALGCAPPPNGPNHKRVSSSADPRDGGSPSCSAKEGGSDAPTPPKEGPLHQVSGGLNTETCLRLTPAVGHFGCSEKDWVAGRGASASMLPALYEFAKPVHGRGSPGGESAVAAPVAQPGSAPRAHLVEVARSNRVGVSTSTEQQVTKSREHLGRASRLAPVSDYLTESSVSQRRAEQPAQLGRAA